MGADARPEEAGPGDQVDPERASPEERRSPLVLVAGIALVYLVLWHLQRILGWAGLRFGPEGPPSVMLWNWVAVAGTLAFVLWVERRRLRSIGLGRPMGMDFLWAVAFWIVSLVITSVVHAVAPPPPSPGLEVMLDLAIPVLLGVIVTAAVTEEIVYRGYLLERLKDLTGNLWVGAGISFVLFVIPHVLFFGPQWLIYHAHGAVLIYILYLWRRNLWACMLLHFMYNMLILLPALGIE